MKAHLYGIAAGITGFGLVLSVAFHPYGIVKAATSSTAILAGANVDHDVAGMLERSCQSCHSDKTEWPWYSYVPPTSILVESDVARARSSMNLSHWDEYTPEEQQVYLIAISAVVKTGEMPPRQYTLIHSEAKLSPSERERISQWVKAEQRRLRLGTTQPRLGG